VLANAYSTFLCVDRGEAIKTKAIESANAALGHNCFLCQSLEHFAKDCPHHRAITSLVTKHNAEYKSRKGRGCNSGSGGLPRANAATSGPSTSMTPASDNTSNNTSDNTNTAGTHETAGVATLLLSNELHAADYWLCDSGASSSMSGDCSVFLSLMADQCPIQLADGKIIYSQGLGPVRFLSNCGYLITIDNVLFVPHLSINLFSVNKFAKEHCNSHSKVTEYPKWKWINQQTGTVEFTTTIHTNNLAYLDWKVAPWAESINVSMEELHACLNHLPFPAVHQLICTQPMDGIPDWGMGTHLNSDFCKDCVNGKLTRAPHTCPAMHAKVPLQQVYTDVHGPIPTQN